MSNYTYYLSNRHIYKNYLVKFFMLFCIVALPCQARKSFFIPFLHNTVSFCQFQKTELKFKLFTIFNI